MNIQDRLTQRHSLVIDKEIARALGVQYALVLCRVAWWCYHNSLEPGKEATHFHDGKWWMYNTLDGWEKDLRALGKTYIRDILGDLERDGFIISAYWHADKWDRSKWYTLRTDNVERFIRLWEFHGSPQKRDPQYAEPWEQYQVELSNQRELERAIEAIASDASEALTSNAIEGQTSNHYSKTQLDVPVQGARSSRVLFASLSQVTPGTLRPRGEVERTSWALSDPELPAVCKALWRVFGPSNSKMKVSTAQKTSLEAPVSIPSNDAPYPSPCEMYTQHPVQFEAWLNKLHDWMKSKGKPINMGGIIQVVRGYHYKGIGWLAHMPQASRVAIESEPAGGTGSVLDAFMEIIGE